VRNSFFIKGILGEVLEAGQGRHDQWAHAPCPFATESFANHAAAAMLAAPSKGLASPTPALALAHVHVPGMNW
jgi:hypothetical protein